MVCLTTNQGHIWKANDPGWYGWLTGALRSADRVVNQNIAFDFAVAIKAAREILLRADWAEDLERLVWQGYASGQIRDTMIRGLLLGIAAGRSRDKVSLGAQVERFLGEHVEGKHGPDVWRLRYAELEDVPLAKWPDAALSYAKLDPIYAVRLYHRQSALGGGETLPGEILHTKASWPLYLAGERGVRTDPVYVAVLRAHLIAARDKAEQTIRAEQPEGDPWLRENGSRNMAALRRRIAGALGVDFERPPEHLATPKGALRTDRETLERCESAPDLQALAGIGRVKTLLSTFIGPLEAREIHPRWWPLVESGRLSCRNPNLTNQPKDKFPTILGEIGVRECFVPAPGGVFVGADYSTAELRALAQVCLDWIGFSRMAEAFREGKDPHRMFAATLLSTTYEDVPEHPEFKTMRQFAKIPNFGFGGGMGAARFAENAERMGVDVTLQGRLGGDPEGAARKLRELWYNTWPEIREYHRRIGQLVDAGTVIQSHRGGLVRGGVGYADAANHYFQNLVARWTKRALFEVAREGRLVRSSPLFGAVPVIIVHDEIILDVPAEQAPEAGDRLVEIMIEAAGEICPDVPIEAEPVLMRRWYKSAETLRDEHGRLIQWEP